mgnify:CR=1 FL=1
MNNPLNLVCSFNADYIPSTAQSRLVYALLAAQVGDLRTEPVPVTLDLVVDASTSMQIPLLTEEQFEELASLGAVREVIADGIPVWRFENVPAGFTKDCPRALDIVKLAIVSAVKALRRDDFCGLVAFAGSARRLAPISPASKTHDLMKAVERLAQIDLGDETRLAAGLSLAVKELTSRGRSGRGAVRRIVLLTDGFALDETDALRWGQQAASASISISTMGLGGDFNEDLLLTLAETSGGNAYFIEEPADIPEAFANELKASQSVALRDLELKLRLYGGVELRRAYRVKPAISDLGLPSQADGSASIPLGDLELQAPPAVLLELIVPPRPAGRYRLAQAVLAHTDKDGMPGPKTSADLLVEVGLDASRAAMINAQVMNLVETVSAYKLQTRALDDAGRGDVAGATVKLRAAATRLLGLGEDELAQAALQEADNLDQQGSLSSAGTKKLRYETRRLTQRLD